MGERALDADDSDSSVSRLASKAVERFETELRNHFDLEESLLFPAIVSELGPQEIVDRLICEHRQIEALVRQLNETPTAMLLRQFYTLLRAHIRLEENELFGYAQSRLSGETLASLGLEFETRAVRVRLEP